MNQNYQNQNRNPNQNQNYQNQNRRPGNNQSYQNNARESATRISCWTCQANSYETCSNNGRLRTCDGSQVTYFLLFKIRFIPRNSVKNPQFLDLLLARGKTTRRPSPTGPNGLQAAPCMRK